MQCPCSSGVAVPGLYRSRSLPHLFAGDSGVGSFSEGPPGPGPQNKLGAGGLVAELRQLLTLKQHYYPEGGWGWVVVCCSVVVQILTHGLQMGSGVLVRDTINKFGQEVTMQAGKTSYSYPVIVIKPFNYVVSLILIK